MTVDYLQGALASVKKAGAAAASDDGPRAARHLMHAAEQYHLAALSVDGQRRQRRLQAAVDLARAALTIRGKPAARKASPTARAPVDGDAEDDAAFVPAERPAVRLSDVIGLDEAKRAIDLAMLRPLKYPQEAKRFGVSAGGGLLLYGPPGTGKTLLGRAVAGEVNAPFYSIKPSDIMSQWVGQAERNISRLFAQAKGHARAVIFVDEVEALVPSRANNRSTVMARVVPQFLAELEGFEGRRSGLMFIGATNRPEKIDEAVLRPGRFDRKVYIGPPGFDERIGLFRKHLEGRDCHPDIDFVALAGETEGCTGADIAGICLEAARRAFEAATGDATAGRQIVEDDLRREIGATPPSVTPAQLRTYEAFRQRGASHS